MFQREVNIRQIFSVIFLITITFFSLIYSYDAYKKYKSQPISTHIRYKLGADGNPFYIEFPQISICELDFDLSHYSLVQVLPKCTFTESSRTFIQSMQTCLENQIEPAEIVENITKYMDTLIPKAMIRFGKMDEIDIDNMWKLIYDKRHGPCWSLGLENSNIYQLTKMRQSRPTIKVLLKNGAFEENANIGVFMHDLMDFPNAYILNPQIFKIYGKFDWGLHIR